MLRCKYGGKDIWKMKAGQKTLRIAALGDKRKDYQYAVCCWRKMRSFIEKAAQAAFDSVFLVQTSGRAVKKQKIIQPLTIFERDGFSFKCVS